jgi:hypothetical protein
MGQVVMPQAAGPGCGIVAYRVARLMIRRAAFSRRLANSSRVAASHKLARRRRLLIVVTQALPQGCSQLARQGKALRCLMIELAEKQPSEIVFPRTRYVAGEVELGRADRDAKAAGDPLRRMTAKNRAKPCS